MRWQRSACRSWRGAGSVGVRGLLLLLLLLPPPLWAAGGPAPAPAPAPPGRSVCYSSPPSVGSVQELAERAEVVIEGKVQGRRQRPGQGQGQGVRAGRAGGPAAAGGDPLPTPGWTGRTPGEETPYLVKVHQVWAAKAGGLQKDRLIAVRLGPWGPTPFPSCGRLKPDSRYIFFMEPDDNRTGGGDAPTLFTASFPPLETGRNLKKEVGRVLCRRCDGSEGSGRHLRRDLLSSPPSYGRAKRNFFSS
uniref:Neuregulin 2 N-terminal domain-containing protein n=1 Tax=Ornithorhynchus anatinus TaxID=9258 RepID=A0A6I8NJU2_ORNAN